MPNTGQLDGQTFKCDGCRREFKKVWLPSNVCCKIENAKHESIFSASLARHLSRSSTKSTASSSGKSKENKPLSVKLPGQKADIQVQYLSNPTMRYVNSLAPFSTLGKSTCGYYFSRETDHKKRKTGIPPSDLVAWQSFTAN